MEKLNQAEPIGLNKKPAKKKRWWKITKAILGHLIPFLIVGGLVAGIYFPLFTESETDSEISVDRQDVLEEIWEAYLTRAEELNREIDLSKFEISLCPFTEDEYNWDNTLSPEEAGMICGKITVPLYHQDPEGETIQIPVVIWPYPEETENQDPLFIMQGGPGGSTLDMYPDYLLGNRPGGEREIVFVDQRGTRYGNPSLICSEEDNPEENGGEDESLNEEDDEDVNNEYLTYLTNCHDRLVFEGVDLSAFNTAEIAHDMEYIRKVFDYPAINFYGVSYGSHIGQYLAAYHPDGLRSLILDGVAPIPLNYLDKIFPNANRMLEDYLKECEEDSFCGENYPDLIDRINHIIDELDEKPINITLHDPHSSDSIREEISGEDFLLYLIFMFRMDSSYAILPYIVTQAEKGNFDLYKWYDEMITFEEVDSDGLYYAVVSGEHTPLNAPKDQAYQIPKLNEIEVESYEDNLAEFEIWDITGTAEILSEMPQSTVPTLLMSGDYDPATPPEYGEIALRSFPKGQHVIDPMGGHGIAFVDGCTVSILNAFIAGPEEVVESNCLTGQERKINLLQPDNISAPFLVKMPENYDIFALSVLIPSIIFIVMTFRGAFQYLRNLWKRTRGTAAHNTARENLLQLRFELSSWIFILGCLLYLIALYLIIYRLNDNPAHFYALAVPTGARGVLFIAALLTLVLIIVFISAIQLWRYRRKVFGRTYLVLQVIFGGFFLAYLVWTDLLWAWAK